MAYKQRHTMWNFSAEANNFICVAILMPRMTNVVNISRGDYSQVCNATDAGSRTDSDDIQTRLSMLKRLKSLVSVARRSPCVRAP